MERKAGGLTLELPDAGLVGGRGVSLGFYCSAETLFHRFGHRTDFIESSAASKDERAGVKIVVRP